MNLLISAGMFFLMLYLCIMLFLPGMNLRDKISSAIVEMKTFVEDVKVDVKDKEEKR
jgi:hypothetical protein